METSFELSRWQEKPKGLSYRRWVVVSTGLRQVLRLRTFRILLFLGWLGGALIAAAGFVFSQSVASGGWLESLAANFGPRAESVVGAFTAVVLLYPDVVVHGLFTTIFGLQSFIALWISFPSFKVWRKSFAFRFREGGYKLNFDLHRSGGVWAWGW